MFFHDFDSKGYVCHQGCILEYLNEDIVEIQYFEWVMGEPSQRQLVSITDITEGKWALYSSGEEMRDAWEHGHVKRHYPNQVR